MYVGKDVSVYLLSLISLNFSQIGCNKTSIGFVPCTYNSFCVSVFQICETYPRELYVPRTASKPIIVGSSKFRSKGRFPVLSYYHKNKEV